MTRSASVSLHALGGLLTAPMFFAHSRELYHCIIQNHGHCTSGSFVGTRPSDICHQTKHVLKLCLPHSWQLGWPAAPPDAQKMLAKRCWHCTVLALLALLAGTPGQQGSIQPNPSASLRFLNRSFYSSIVLYDLFARGTRKATAAYNLIKLSHPYPFSFAHKSLIDWH